MQVKGGSGTPTGREESSLSAFVFLQQLYLTFSQAVIRQTAGQTVDVSFLSHFFFFLSPPSVQSMFYRPLRPKTASGACLKVSQHIFRPPVSESELVVGWTTSEDVAQCRK